MWILELFSEGIPLVLDPVVTRVRAWLAYRRLYSAAERREHARQLAASGTRR